MSDPKNLKCVQVIMEKGFVVKMRELYGREIAGLLALVRAQLYVSLAETQTHIPALQMLK